MTGMAGSLRLVVGLDAAGHCALREQYSSQLHRVLQLIPGDVPEEGLLYVLNPTGGVLQGDRLEADIRVERGAHAIVTTPSATKIYRAEQHASESHTRLRVARGATLEYLPEPLIPYSGSRYVERLSADVESGGRLLAWELLAPGRAARGELFDYDLLGLRLELKEGGRVVLRERAELRPAREKFPRLAMGQATHYGVLIAFGGEAQRLEAAIREDLGEQQAGVSRLRGSGIIVKALAGGRQTLEALFHRIRERILCQWTGRSASLLRST
jgi:urease accessory protein